MLNVNSNSKLLRSSLYIYIGAALLGVARTSVVFDTCLLFGDRVVVDS